MPVIALFLLALPLLFAFAVVAVVLGTVAAVLGFLISLPFRILGLAFRLAGLAIALPFLLVAALLGGGFLLLPILPLALLVLGVIWLFKRHDRRTVGA